MGQLTSFHGCCPFALPVVANDAFFALAYTDKVKKKKKSSKRVSRMSQQQLRAEREVVERQLAQVNQELGVQAATGGHPASDSDNSSDEEQSDHAQAQPPLPKQPATVAAQTPASSIGSGAAATTGEISTPSEAATAVAPPGPVTEQSVSASSETVSFEVNRQESSQTWTAGPSSSTESKQKLEILPAEEDSAADDAELKVENASAWAELSSAAPADGVEAAENTASTADEADFEKFRRLNEEKMQRGRAQAELAEQKRREREMEEEQRRKEVQSRAELEAKRKEEEENNAQLAAEEERRRQAEERQRAREEAKRAREAMTSDVDLSQQSEVMNAFHAGEDNYGEDGS